MSTADPEDVDLDPDDPDLDDLGDLGDGDEDDPKDKAPAGKPMPTSQEEWDKVQRKLKRQEDRITALVGKGPKGKPVADVDRQLAAQLRKGKADPDDEPEDDGEAERWKGIAIQNAAASQIAAAGFTGTAKQAARLARLIDTSRVVPGSDGTFDLEDEVDDLVDQYPQLFAPAGQRRPVPRVRRADSKDSAPAKDASLRTSERMLKEAGYR